MAISIECTGNSLNDAIYDALKRLDKQLNEVNVEILAHRGLFKKAKVRVTVIEDVTSNEANTTPAKPIEAVEKPRPKVGVLVRQEKPDAPEANERQDRPQRQDRQERFARPQRQDRPERQDRQERDNRERKPVSQKHTEPERNDVVRSEAPRKEREDEPRRSNAAVTPEIMDKALKLLDGLLERMDIPCERSGKIEDGELYISIKTDSGALIGYRGETLDSIEYLIGFIINREGDKYYRINIDCNDYREKRKDILISIAHKMADKCVKTGRKVVLEPMNSAGRKIIHSALTDNEKVITRSEGSEPNRRVVILCKRNKA